MLCRIGARGLEPILRSAKQKVRGTCHLVAANAEEGCDLPGLRPVAAGRPAQAWLGAGAGRFEDVCSGWHRG